MTATKDASLLAHFFRRIVLATAQTQEESKQQKMKAVLPSAKAEGALILSSYWWEVVSSL